MEQNTFSAISKRQTPIVVNILILNVDFVIKIPVLFSKENIQAPEIHNRFGYFIRINTEYRADCRH